MDDPIFQPWTDADDAEAEAEAQESDGSRPASAGPGPGPGPDAPRWKSPVGARGVPAQRPVPVPLPPPLPDAPTAVRPAPRPQRARRLRETVLPRLEWLALKLQTAGHRTILDDGLDDVIPSLRFRFAPRRSPFDEPVPDQGAVLEITSGGSDPLHVVGRLWLDPLSAEPTEEVRIPAPKLTEEWVDRLLLDFVGKALRPPI